MLASSSGIAYSQHFCNGLEMLSGITLGEQHLSCGMEMEEPPCGDTTIVSAVHHCCENIVEQVKTDNNFAKASFEIDFNKVFVTSFVSVFVFQEVEIASEKNDFFAHYNPPPIDKDIPVLYQTFLI